jgi:copper chaperone
MCSDGKDPRYVTSSRDCIVIAAINCSVRQRTDVRKRDVHRRKHLDYTVECGRSKPLQAISGSSSRPEADEKRGKHPSDSLQHRGTNMQTETINVTGMTCGGCVGKVTKTLTAVPGVGRVDVSLPGKASVDFDEKLTSRAHLQSAIKDAGYGVAVGEDASASPTKGGCCG